MTKKPSFFSFSFFLHFRVKKYSRTTVIKNNIDDQGARALSIQSFQSIYMFNPGEIKGFCPKSCYLKPSSNLVLNVMQPPGPDLQYGSVPRAPHSDGKTFLVFSCIWLEDVAKISKAPGAQRNVNSARK